MRSPIFLRSEFHGTHKYVLLSIFLRLPQPGGPGSCIYFLWEQGSPVISPGIEAALLQIIKERRKTGRLTVSRNMSLTLTLTLIRSTASHKR
jgi:hypothetical protein